MKKNEKRANTSHVHDPAGVIGLGRRGAVLILIGLLATGSYLVLPRKVAALGGNISLTVVISQVYGGAGCGTAGCSTYQNDYIELYNRSHTPISVNGWSVQYAAATGTAWQVTALPNFTIQPGQYFLVAESFGANGVNPLPTPDATGTIAMSATAAKVALVNNTTALSGACPATVGILDLVGYGATANCFETAVAPAPSTTTSDIRGGGGNTETDNNSTDFQALSPTPRNTAAALNTPTATNGQVSGHISDSKGDPVAGAAIRLSGTQNRLAVTDSFGNYNFESVETNGVYTVTPTRANFSFSPAQRSFSISGQNTDAAFTAVANGGANPLDRTEYFVRQQYIDFLGREPDEAGLNFWVNNIESCGADAGCREVKRRDTSAAFFLSIEFQQTGYFVDLMYKSAFGDLPGATVPVMLSEFKPDAQAIGQGVIVNQAGWEQQLAANKELFATEFVQRPRLAASYPMTMTPDQFVDRLYLNAGVTPAAIDRAAVVSEFGFATNSSDQLARGRALRRVAENSVLRQQELNRAFVLMQYFGYLRRDPNAPPDENYEGYNFWLGKLESFNGNYADAEMVQAFLLAGEYRQRFPR
jgi:hypothetical protein